MNAWFENANMGMSFSLSEDVGAPELRNPNHSAMRANSWLAGMIRRVLG